VGLKSHIDRVKTLLVGDRQTVAGFVYGTIIVMSVLSAGAKSYRHSLWQLDALAAISALVLWVAHVYAHGLGESLRLGRRLSVGEVRSVARREYSIVLAAVPPVIAVALGAAGVIPAGSALWLAFGSGVVTLTAQGVRYARLEDLSFLATLVTVSINVLVGLTIIAAEVLVAH
jgi:hypothetical protein